MVTHISHSPTETLELGAEWGRTLGMGWVVGLSGDLGAGKTQLVKGLALGLGIQSRITSPTFNLIHIYEGGRLPLNHIDLYRLESPLEVRSAGLEEYITEPRGITVVEWMERWMLNTRLESPLIHFREVKIKTLTISEREISYEDFGP